MVSSRRRNWTLALLFAAGTLNIFDRQIVNILGQDIKVELGISDAQLGLLTGTAFGLFYALMGIPLGRIADRVDRIRLVAVSLALWSGFTALCGLAGGFAQLFVARMGVGIGEAGSQPASTALIPDLFSEERRNSAMSILVAGVPAGSFLGLLLGGYIAASLGWRTAFFVAGAPGFLIALMMWLTLRDPRAAPGKARTVAAGNLIEALQTLGARPRFRWLALALACSTFLVYASGAWLPPFLIRVHHMTTAQTGSFAALAVGVGGGIGALGGGVVCDLLRTRVPAVESKMMLLILAGSIPALLVTVLATDRMVVLVAMFTYNICAYAWLGPGATLIQRAATVETRALAIAISSTVASILSLGLGLPLVGALSDALVREYRENAIGYALAAGVLVAAVLGMVAHWRALRQVVPAAEPVQQFV